MSTKDKDVHDPLSRQAFESIVYNAVGRASEIGTFPAYALSHSTGNSGWSVGIVQWDFGQPGRGHKVEELLQRYQGWAAPDMRFDAAELASLSSRLQRRGQAGNELDQAEQTRLNSYLRSSDGRVFVEGLNREQLDYKWRQVGESLAEIPWLQRLRDSEPAQVTEIVTMANKLFNQNEIRGRRLRSHLQQTEMTSEDVQAWIASTGIEGLNKNARKAIVSGSEQALEGARLLNALESGDSALSRRWREIAQNGGGNLSSGFEFNPDLQLFDAMLRHPSNGIRLLRQVEGDGPPTAVSIRGINALARIEMAEVRADASGAIALTTTRDTEYALHDALWSLDRAPLATKRAADEPDYTEGWRARPRMPLRGADHPAADDLRSQIRALYEEHDVPLSTEQLERTTATLLRDAYLGGNDRIEMIAFSVNPDQGHLDPDGKLIAWHGNPRDPATVWSSMPLKLSESLPLSEIWQDVDNAMHQRLQTAASLHDRTHSLAQQPHYSPAVA